MLVSPPNHADTPVFKQDTHQEIAHAFICPCSCATHLLGLSHQLLTKQERGSLLQFLAGLSQNGGLATSWENDTDAASGKGSPAGKIGRSHMCCCLLRASRGTSHGPLGSSARCSTLISLTTHSPVVYHQNWCRPAASQSLMSALTISMEHSTSCPLRPCPRLSRY